MLAMLTARLRQAAYLLLFDFLRDFEYSLATIEPICRDMMPHVGFSRLPVDRQGRSLQRVV